jgi:hypothetical protein
MRTYKRAFETGRWVPGQVVASTHKAVDKAKRRLRELMAQPDRGDMGALFLDNEDKPFVTERLGRFAE